MPSDDPVLPLRGGCQCGAVRYELRAIPTGASICHCRMCQKAGGGPFMAFTGVNSADLVFTRGAPTKFASSEIAERGFCAACGTPLTYAMKARARIGVTLGSLDDPARFAPRDQLGVESRTPWFDSLAGLPEHRTGDWLAKVGLAEVGSHQHPDRET